MSLLRRSTFVLVAALVLAEANVPGATHAAANDYTYNAYLNPSNPRVGEFYGLFVEVRNNTGRAMYVRVNITSIPQGDQLQGGPNQERYLPAGGVQTIHFQIYCGVEGGTVNYSVGARFAN